MHFSRNLHKASRPAAYFFVTLLILASLDMFMGNNAPEAWRTLKDRMFQFHSSTDVWWFLMILVAWAIIFPRNPSPAAESTAWKDVLRFLRSGSIFFLLVLLCSKVFHNSLNPAAFYVVALVLALELISTTTRILTRNFGGEKDKPRAVIVGSGRRASRAWREIRVNMESSVEMLGFVDSREPSHMAPDIANRLISSVENLRSAILVNHIDRIYIAMPLRSCYDQVEKIIDTATALGVQIFCMEDIFFTATRQVAIGDEVFIRLMPLRQRSSVFQWSKRVLDVLTSLVGIMALLPVGIVVAFWIMQSGPGPLFVFEERLGLDGTRFKMWRLRTFKWSPETTNSPHSLNLFEENEGRTTRFGRVLRQNSLDEIAQFWNVLKGEMSIVGPRPMSLNDAYHASDSEISDRVRVRPGMTGLWQVSGRSTLNRQESRDLNRQYVKSRSLSQDFKIVLRTIPVLLTKNAASQGPR